MNPPSPASSRQTATPEWLVNLSAFGWRVLVVAVLAAAVLLIARALIVVVASILVALLISASVAPAMTFLRKRGWGIQTAAGAVTAAVVGVVTVVVVLVAISAAPYLVDLARQINAGLTKLSDSAVAGTVPPDVGRVLSLALSSVEGAVSETVASVGSTVATIATVAVLAAILVFFFLRDGPKALVNAVPPRTPHRHQIIALFGRRAIPSAGRYMRIAAGYGTVDALLALVFMALLQVPLAIPLALLMFLGGFVPYLGFPVVASILALVAYASLGTQVAAILLALLIGMYWLTRRVLRPFLRPEPIGLSPAAVLVTVLVSAALGGYAGMVAAVPALILARAARDAMVLVLDPGPGVSRQILVPGWLDRLSDVAWRLLVVGALALLAVGIVLAFPIVMLPLLVAAVLAAPLAPLVRVLVSRGWSTFRAALVVTVTTVVVVVGVVVLAAASLVPQSQQLVATAGEGARQADSSGVLADTVGGVGSAILSSVGVAIAGIAVVILLSTVLCFYLLRDGASLWRSLVERLPARTRDPLTGIAEDSVSILSRYMIGTGAIAAFGAATQFVTMAVLGLPLALPLAVLSFFGGFIPYIGSFITTGLAFLVTVATGSPFDILVMLIFTLVFNIVTGNVVAPIVYSRAVNLHPAVVLLAIPAGNAIAGILGMFLAVPAVAIVTTTWRPLVQLAGTMPPAIRTPAPEPVPPVVVALPVVAVAPTIAAADPAGDPGADPERDEGGWRGLLHRVASWRPGASAPR